MGDGNIMYIGYCLNCAMNYTCHVFHFKRLFCKSGMSKFVAQLVKSSTSNMAVTSWLYYKRWKSQLYTVSVMALGEHWTRRHHSHDCWVCSLSNSAFPHCIKFQFRNDIVIDKHQMCNWCHNSNRFKNVFVIFWKKVRWCSWVMGVSDGALGWGRNSFPTTVIYHLESISFPLLQQWPLDYQLWSISWYSI